MLNVRPAQLLVAWIMPARRRLWRSWWTRMFIRSVRLWASSSRRWSMTGKYGERRERFWLPDCHPWATCWSLPGTNLTYVRSLSCITLGSKQPTKGDVGGQKTLRTYWKNYFEKTDTLIWVVDATDEDRIEDCRQELKSLLQEEARLYINELSYIYLYIYVYKYTVLRFHIFTST